MNSLELSIKGGGAKLDNILATTNGVQYNQSTAVTGLHGRSGSEHKDECRFYSLSNSVAKIKLDKQATLNGTYAQINNMPNIMRSILEKSQLATTFISPKQILKKHFSSNLTTIQNIDKVMRSYSVMNTGKNNIADTKILAG